MRFSKAFIPTLKTVNEATMASHRFLLRAGYIRQLASGIYNYLPLAIKVLQNIEYIIRDEMNSIGGQELVLPVLHPATLWQQTGRYEAYGPELMHFQDRHKRFFVLGPTHEEVITTLVSDAISTYRRLPLLLYQLQTKFRDEIRPRSGLLRGREFLMKDAYSFHADQESLLVTYQDVLSAYTNIFHRCHLHIEVAEASAGSIGGSNTHEFLVTSEAGEDTVVVCEHCGYAANIEQAMFTPMINDEISSHDTLFDIQEILTPSCSSIDEVAAFFKLKAADIVKSLLIMVDDKPVLALIRGDRTLSLMNVQKQCKSSNCVLADDKQVLELTGVRPGFLGPLNLPNKLPLLIDQELCKMPEWIVGANKQDTHLRYVSLKRDLDQLPYEICHLREIALGDQCIHCPNQTLIWKRGIEIGHIFQLEKRYSEPLKAHFLDTEGKEQAFWMGCYGIGVSRLMAAIVEQHHDEYGLVWPLPVAPYIVHLIVVNLKQEEQKVWGERLYKQFQEHHLSVIFDDRTERVGIKFNEADLLGMPIHIIIGKNISDGYVDWKIRQTGEKGQIQVSEVVNWVKELKEKGMKKV